MTSFFKSGENGLLLPLSVLPKICDTKKESKFSYESIFQKSVELSKLFCKYGVDIDRSPDLRRLLESSKTLYEEWEKNQCKDLKNLDTLWDGLTMLGICEVTLPLDGHNKANEMLNRLIDGHIHMLNHGYSRAKNALWELGIYSRARRGGLNVDIQEPDILWNEENEMTGVACKKIYSEKNADKPLQDAVRQIGKSTRYGFVALNLDELIPERHRFVTTSLELGREELQEINARFLKTLETRCIRYFKDNRLTGAIVSTSCITIIKGDHELPFLNTQWQVWTHPNLADDHKRRITKFKQAIEIASA